MLLEYDSVFASYDEFNDGFYLGFGTNRSKEWSIENSFVKFFDNSLYGLFDFWIRFAFWAFDIYIFSCQFFC